MLMAAVVTQRQSGESNRCMRRAGESVRVFSFSSLRTTCEGLRLQNGIQQVVETHQKAKYVACGQCSTSVVETWQNLQNARHFAKVGCELLAI